MAAGREGGAVRGGRGWRLWLVCALVLGGAVAVMYAAWTVWMASAALRVSVRNDRLVLENRGAAISGARIDVSFGRSSVRVERAVIPPGESTIPIAELEPGVDPRAFSGATVTGTRRGVGWTWYGAGLASGDEAGGAELP